MDAKQVSIYAVQTHEKQYLARSEKSKFQLFATEFDDSLKKSSLGKPQHHLTTSDTLQTIIKGHRTM